MRISIVYTTKRSTGECLFNRTLHHLMDQLQPKTGNPLDFFWFLCIILISCLPDVFQKNPIMEKEKVNFLKNTKEYWWLFLGITLCHLIEQLRPKTGNKFPFNPHNYNNTLLNINSLVVLAQVFFWNTKDADEKYAFMGINENDQEPG